ncbi:MAG: hypothetical protein MR902_04300 [Campylobacter sp.]|nr:hypothetical protein [Campylobacter sp.]
MATLLSHNQDIKECFSSLNHDFCFKTLSHYQDIISQIPTYQNSLIHAHSKNQISLARSWSDNYDDNLSAFRHSLLKIKKLT